MLEVQDPIEIRKRLKSVPWDPSEAYRGVIERMRDRHFAGRILGWILHAQRPLTMTELQIALNFDQDEFSFLPYEPPVPESIVLTCCGLIEHRRDTGLVSFSHAMVLQYLTEHPFEELASHSLLALTCLAYYRTPDFEAAAKEFNARRRKQDWSFGVYAAHFWNIHSKLAGRSSTVEVKILETFSSDIWRVADSQLHADLDGRTGWTGPLLPFLVGKGLAAVVMQPLSDVSTADSTIPQSDVSYIADLYVPQFIWS